MGRRRVDEPADSLELLLDTICNVFGGVILVAILVVLQTQDAAQTVALVVAADLRLKQAEYEVGKAARELASLQAELAAASSEAAQLAPELEAAVRKGEFLDAIEAAERQLERERQAAAAARRARLEAEARAEAERERTRRLGRAAEETRARAGAVPEAFRRDVRLPMWHDQAAPFQRSLLIDGDQVYALPEACHAEALGVRFATRYRPRNGAGLRVHDATTSAAAFAELLSGHTPRGTFVSFWVTDRTESFEVFQLLRAVALERTFEYTVSAYDRAEGLVLQPGRPKAE